MAQPNSEAWQIDEQSQEDENFPNVQVESAEDPFDMFGSGSDEEYSLRTPEQKLTSQKKGDSKENTSESYLNSGNGSSDISGKEGSEAMSPSSSSSSSDTEFASCLPKKIFVGRHVNDVDVLQPKMIEIEADTFDMKENLHTPERDGEAMLKEKDMLYEKLLEKVAIYETELKSARNKIQASEDEIGKLKYENLTLAEELGGTIEKLRISENNLKEMEIRFRNELLEGQELLEAKVDLANQSINLLRDELCSERSRGSKLKEMLAKTTNDLTDYSREVDELTLALHDTQEDFSKDKSQFQSEVTILQEQNDALKTRLNEAEMRNKILEEQIKQHEVENIEIKKFNEVQKANLLNEFQQCQTDLSQKTQLVESLNKSLDSSKFKYDMLMSEKDETFAKLETLLAEVTSRCNNIQQLEENISRLSAEQRDLVGKLQKAEKLVEELSLKVTDQEKELEKQRVSICDRADEKRAAIRQLCFSLEYYRGEYHELRQALLKHKRPVVMAS